MQSIGEDWQGLSFFHNTQHGEHSLSFPGTSTQYGSDIGVPLYPEHRDDGIA